MVHSASLDQVKMAFLFNFAKYVNWPESSFESNESPFTICVNADKRLITLLRLTVKNEVRNNRSFKIVEITGSNKTEQCHISFVSKLHYSSMFPVLKTATLLVSDHENFAPEGGMIEIREQDQRLKLLINYKQVRKSGLTISSNLLKLSTIVE